MTSNNLAFALVIADCAKSRMPLIIIYQHNLGRARLEFAAVQKILLHSDDYGELILASRQPNHRFAMFFV